MIIHHIGLVVNNIEEHFRKYFCDALGYKEIGQTFVDTRIGVAVAFINLNDKIFLELVQPLDDKSPVQGYLKKRGQTLHHLCFEVEKIDEECERLRSKDYMITMQPTPAVAFNNRRVAFLISRDEDYLIELLEQK
jgi:methylmalonyl-CoA/ethylmalonyl-CoA epimerase